MRALTVGHKPRFVSKNEVSRVRLARDGQATSKVDSRKSKDERVRLVVRVSLSRLRGRAGWGPWRRVPRLRLVFARIRYPLFASCIFGYQRASSVIRIILLHITQPVFRFRNWETGTEENCILKPQMKADERQV